MQIGDVFYFSLQRSYVGLAGDNIELDPNPFADDFPCTVNTEKGGVFVTENICYNW